MTAFTLTLALLALAAPMDTSTLTLKDDGRPLEMIYPNDRHVQVVSLTGTWNKPPADGADHYVNFFFPNGYHYAHKVNRGADYAAFLNGDVRAMLYPNKLELAGVCPQGVVQVAVSFGVEACDLSSPALISKPIKLDLPLYRPVRRGAQPPPLLPPPQVEPPRPGDAPKPGEGAPKPGDGAPKG